LSIATAAQAEINAIANLCDVQHDSGKQGCTPGFWKNHGRLELLHRNAESRQRVHEAMIQASSTPPDFEMPPPVSARHSGLNAAVSAGYIFGSEYLQRSGNTASLWSARRTFPARSTRRLGDFNQ
jgi:hypothetical protein